MSDASPAWMTKDETDERERVRYLVVNLDAWTRSTVGGIWETRVAYGDRELWVMLDVRDRGADPSITAVVGGNGIWETFDKMVPEVRGLFRGHWDFWYRPEWVIRNKVVL